MPTVAHLYAFIIGVDTHARTHTYAVTAANGEQLAIEAFPNTAPGRKRAILSAATVLCSLARFRVPATGSLKLLGATRLSGVVQGSPTRWMLPLLPRRRCHLKSRIYAIHDRTMESVRLCVCWWPLENK